MEVLFKVGDSGGSRDGDIIAIEPDGWHIPGADMAAWIQDAKEPALLVSMPRYLADRMRRDVLRILWHVANTPPGQPEYERAVADMAKAADVGWDTNFGMVDLKVHGVVRVPDLSIHEQRELLDRDWVQDHTGKVLGKKRYKVDYAAVLPAQKVANLRDSAKRVDVDRASAPLAKTVLVDSPRTVEKV